jgi:hypothetical protein
MPGNNPVNQALGGLGKTLSDVAYDAQVDANASKVMGKAVEFNAKRLDLLNNPKTGLLTTQGENAINISQKGSEEFDKIYAESLEGMNPAQQQLFKQHTANEKNEVLLQLNRHEAQQGKALQITNATALVDSQAQVLSTLYTDIDGSFQERLKQVQAATLDLAHMHGYSDTSPAAQGMVNDVTDKAYKNAITQIADSGDPMKAQEVLNKYSGHIEPGTVALLQHQLKPKLDAYAVDGVLAKVNAVMGKDPDAPFDIDKRYEAVKATTTDPNVRKLAYAELERQERTHTQATADRFKSLSGSLYMKARDDWDNKRETDVNKVRKSPEFAQLPTNEQEKVLDKVDTENRLIQSEKAKQENERRRLAGDERRERNERKREAREDKRDHDRDMKEKWDGNFNHYYNNPEELAQMSKEEFEGVSGDVSHVDYKKLSDMRKKLVSPAALHKASMESGVVWNVLDKMPGLSAEDKKKYIVKAQSFVDAEEKALGRELKSSEAEGVIIGAMQHVSTTEHHWYGDKKVEKPIADVIKPADLAKIEMLEKKRGKKLSDKQRSALLEELAGGK